MPTPFALFSPFCRINKQVWWNNILLNLVVIPICKLLNLSFNHFGPNKRNFKVICFHLKSGSTISWKMRITFYSLNISKNKKSENILNLGFWKKISIGFISSTKLFLSDIRGLRYTGLKKGRLPCWTHGSPCYTMSFKIV